MSKSEEKLHELIESAISHRQEEYEELKKLCEQLQNDQNKRLIVSSFVIKKVKERNDYFELDIKSDSAAVLNLWKLGLYAAFQKFNLNTITISIEITNNCTISVTMSPDVFEKVVEFLYPLAHKTECTETGFKKYFVALTASDHRKDLQEVLKLVLEIQSDWTDQVVAKWEKLKENGDNTLSARDFYFSDEAAYAAKVEDNLIGKRTILYFDSDELEDTLLWGVYFNWVLSVLNIPSTTIRENFKDGIFGVTMNTEDHERLVDMIKPLSKRIQAQRMCLYTVIPNIMNIASQLVTSGSVIHSRLTDIKNAQYIPWLDFVRKVEPSSVEYVRSSVIYPGMEREMEDFLLPLADLVGTIETSTDEGRSEIPLPSLTIPALKLILSRKKCTELIVDNTMLSIEDAEHLVQFFHHHSIRCSLRCSTAEATFNTRMGEYLITSYIDRFECRGMILGHNKYLIAL